MRTQTHAAQAAGPLSPALARNLARVAPLLERFRAGTVPHHIAGRADPGTGSTFTDCDPTDGRVLAHVAADVDRAARAAAAAFLAWRDLDASVRRRILHTIADRIEARADEIASSRASTRASRFAT